jgi:hypothetical protein
MGKQKRRGGKQRNSEGKARKRERGEHGKSWGKEGKKREEEASNEWMLKEQGRKRSIGKQAKSVGTEEGRKVNWRIGGKWRCKEYWRIRKDGEKDCWEKRNEKESSKQGKEIQTRGKRGKMKWKARKEWTEGVEIK